MKLLFAIKSLAVEGGGAERVLVDLANYLLERGVDIHLATFDPPQSSVFYALNPNIKIHYFDFGQPGVPTVAKAYLKAIPHIRRSVKEIAPDLTIAFMHSTYVPLGLALLGMGAKLITSEHVGYRHYIGSSVQDRLAKFIRSKALATTVPSHQVRLGYPVNEHEKIHVLPNPLDLSPHSDMAVAPRSLKQLLCVGRFMEEKDHETLFEAFALLADDFPDWHLKCVGDGVMRAQLEQKRSDLGLVERISMPGVSTEMAREYKEASLVAIPSKYESFGMVAVEALASRRPVIGFDETGGLTEIISHNHNGWLVSPQGDRVLAYRDGLARLMSDYDLRSSLAKNGPNSVQKYEAKQVLAQWYDFLGKF